MTFDLRIITVDYGEWTLWASLVFSTTFAVLLGVAVGKRIAGVRNAWLKGLVAVAAAGALWFGMALTAVAAFQMLFMATNGGASVCTVLVRPVLVIPSVVVVASQALGWWMPRRTTDESGRPTKA